MSQPAPSSTPPSAIAIVGMACRVPGADDADALWRALSEGRSGITALSNAELLAAGVDPDLLENPDYVRARGVLPGAELFDAAFFGYTPREAELTDPQQRVFLECAWNALEDAGYDPSACPGSVGVYAGAGWNSYQTFHLAPGGLLESDAGHQTLLGNEKDHLATRVSYRLDLRGPSVCVQTACSTSLVATAMACHALLTWQCDMALAGGVSILFPQGGHLYRPGGILSPDGACRAFDARAEGTVLGSGAGVVVLKRLEDALADGDFIHAVVLAAAINNDGAAKAGYTAPSAEGQARCIFEAHQLAGVPADSITYVEAHGTGTVLGDPIEIAGLTAAFREGTDARGFCAIGSVKSNLGHLDAAAGVAGLIKTALALRHGEIPPSLNFDQPNPQIRFDETPFYVNASLRSWTSRGPRRAGVSSFGLGGTNAHLVLEEAPPVPPSRPDPGPQLLLLSARTPAALDVAAARLATHLRDKPGLEMADVGYTLRVGRKAFAHRRSLVSRSVEEAASALEAGSGAVSVPARERPVAFLFTGQGSQHVNMGRALYEADAVFRREADRCLDLLATREGLDLRPLLYPAHPARPEDEEALRQTANAQPALFVLEYALARAWIERGVEMESATGHSIGEYVAATLAGVFSLEDALSVVALRGRLMQALPAGAMLAIPLSEAEVEALLGPEVSLAAVNTPSSCVVSGTREAIGALRAQLEAQGIEPHELHTSHAFHSHMVEPALAPFHARMAAVRLRPPSIAFVSTLTGRWITDAEATDPAYWVRHVRAPVRFADGLATLAAGEERVLLEVGPGRTLAQFARRRAGRSPADVVLASLPHPRDERSAHEHFLETLGELWCAGVPIRRDADASAGRRRVRLPVYPFERQRYWIDPPARGAREARHPSASAIWHELAEAAGAEGRRSLAEFDLAGHRARREALDAYSLAALHDAVRRLSASAVSIASGNGMRARLGVVPRYRQLIGSILSTLQTNGRVRMEGGEPAVLPAPAGESLDALFARAMEAWRAAPAVPELARACAEALPHVLRGEREPLELFTSVVEVGRAPQLAEGSLEGCYRRVLRAAVDRLTGTLPKDTPLRVIEVGGGTGIATEGILPAFPAGRTSYTFTDAGRAFLDGARRKFSACPFLRFGVLDLEKAPVEQGYTAGGFDIAVAVNVLHVTRDIARTLRHVRSLLAPGGLLLLWEITEPTPDFELTYGLLMNPPEDGVRDQGNPFLSRAAWNEALLANGFARVSSIPNEEELGEHVILAQADEGSEGAEPAFSRPAAAAATRTGASLEKKADIGEWFHVPSWKRSLAPAPTAPMLGEHWLVLGTDDALAEELAAGATERGASAVTVRPGAGFRREADGAFTVDPSSGEDYRQLLDALRAEGRRPARVIHAWGAVSAPEETCAELWRLLLLVQALGDSADPEPVELTLVSSGIHEVTGEETVDPNRAMLLGPCRVIPLEYPNIACRSIDVFPVEGARTAAGRIVSEILGGAPDAVVAYRREHRWLPEVEPVRLPALPDLPPALRREGIYLITGGLGKIGLVLARHLAEAGGARLVLTTRGAFPPEEEWGRHEESGGPHAGTIAALREIRALGGDVLVGTADAADEAAMRALVSTAETRFGPVHGVIHSAGVLGDGGIQQKSVAQLREVVRPKVEGTIVLDRLFAGRRLDFFLLFSSLSAVKPGFGQTAYSAANCFVDAWVHSPAGRRARAACLSWDVWQGGGMAYDATAPRALQALKHADFAERGILPDEGVEVFRRVLASAAPHVMVSTSDYLRTPDVDLPRLYFEKAVEAAADAPARHVRPGISTAHVPPGTDAEVMLAEMWESLLGIDGIGIDDDFFELGADSLIGTQLINRIRGGFGIKLPVKAVYDYRTIRVMAAAVEQALVAQASPEQLAEALEQTAATVAQ